MKRSTWWIWSLIAGLAACGVVGWRVVSQHHEVQRQKIENSLTGIDAAALEGRVSDLNPVSAQQLTLANRLKSSLAVKESDSSIHPVNRPIFTYWEGWARLNSGLNAIEEALGSGGRVADPRAETYEQAWERIESALVDSNFDMPTGMNAEDYKRFRTHIQKQWMGVDDQALVDSLGLVIELRDGKPIVRSADEGALAAIGVKFAANAPEKPDFSVLVANGEISVPQREFLATRLAALGKAEAASFKLARRFEELGLPEHAWQHRRVVTEDIKVPGSAYSLRSLTGQALGARKRQIAALSRMLNDPLNVDLLDRLRDERARWKDAVQRLERETIEAAPLAASVMADLDDGRPSRWDVLRDENLRRKSAIERELDLLNEFDPELEATMLESEVKDPADIPDIVSRKEARIADEKLNITKSRLVRLERVSIALDAIRDFSQRVLAMGEADAGNDGADTLGSFTDADLMMLLQSEGPFGHFFAKTGALENQAQIVQALRRLLLADLSVIRADAALLMGQGEKAKEYLYRNSADLSVLRDAILSTLPEFTIQTRRRLEGVDLTTPDQQLRANLMFLTEIAAEQVAMGRAPVGPSNADRARHAAFADELSALRATLIKASFSHAEFSHQLVLEHMREMTGPSRPTVSWRAADRARLAWSMWERGVLQFREGERASEPKHPLDTLDFKTDPEMRELRRFIDMEMRYRELRDNAIIEYTAFLDSDHAEVARRALLGITTLKIEDIGYQYGWKWEHGHSPDPMVESNGIRSPGYGLFSYVEAAPARIATSESAMTYPRGGSWLGYQETVDTYRRGPSNEKVAELEAMLSKLRDSTPAAGADIWVASRWLSGRLMEFVPTQRSRRSIGASTYYLGDLPGALSEYYIPLLNGPNGASDEAVVRNRYIPLEVEFRRLNSKIKRMIDSVDDSDPLALSALFSALAPVRMDGTITEGDIADFWAQYFGGIVKRAPGMVSLPDAVYDLSFDLGGLATQRAELLLANSTTESNELKAEAARATERARSLYRSAGRVLFDHVSQFPDELNVAQRQLKIGNAYFNSGDFVFAIHAYRQYFADRLASDSKFERAEPYFVVNRIGEAYMKLGIYEGNALRQATESGDQAAILRETTPESMTIDGAIPAFTWNIARTRRLMQEAGQGGLPQGSLPPSGALGSFINMASAKIEAGRLRAARGDERGMAMLSEAIDLLRRDLIESRLFPSPVPLFNDSLYFRDAQFHVGQAELELARAHRAQVAANRDSAVFQGHLRRAAESFDHITQNWPQPLNRAVLARSGRGSSSVSDAMQEVGMGSERFSDDIYYLTILGRAETEWLKAVHHDDKLSQEVMQALSVADNHLTFLLRELDAIHGKDSPLKGTTFGFPDLSRRARFLSADVVYLQARTLRDRLDDGGANQFDVIKGYDRAIAAYQSARALHPNTYEALWAYAQELNCHRALSRWRSNHEGEARKMLAAADTFMDAMPADAFVLAPRDMTREAFTEYFKWYDVLARD